MVERKTTLPSLPEEIILEILYRLPVRSLLRFRCVSKSWRSTISSKVFAESHLQMSVRSPNLNSRLLIFSPFYVKSINHHELSLPFITTELDHPLENHDPAVYITILGSCNGLVCLVVDDDKSIILYNPSTRHYRSISLLNSVSPPGTLYSYRGICFDSDLHEYIVVRDKSTRPCIDKKFEVELLSIKDYAHQPTTVKKLSYDFAEGFIYSTLFFNGSFHFLVHRLNRLHCQRKEIIIRMDFAREVFDEVPEPDVCNASDRWAKLKVVGGCLSLISSPHQPFTRTESIDIWVMKEYGVKTSWTKLLSIPTTYYAYVEPLNFKSDREILLAVSNGYCKELSIFNSEESSFENAFTDNDLCGFVIAVYVESLISP